MPLRRTAPGAAGLPACGDSMPRLFLTVALLATLLPLGTAFAFDADKPDSVALAFLPFEPEREEDAAISFLLEDYVQANLSRRIRHPVTMGPELQPALLNGVKACVADADCIMLLGAQFNASLVVRASVFRSGSELQLETEWFTTGNGVRVGRERFTFEPGQEKAMVDGLATAFETYFDSSLRVTHANRAGEGGVVGDTGDQGDRLAEYRERGEKRVSSRRQDFDDDRDDVSERSDPTADLRAVVGDDDDADEPPRGRADRRREDRSAAPVGNRDADDDVEEDDRDDRASRSGRADRSSPDRSRPDRSRPDRSRSAPGEEDDDDLINLDANDPTGRSVATYADAQRQGYSRREYDRYVNSGRTFSDYHDARWTLGKRFGVRIGGVYALGYLTRRYASTIFIRVGGVKTDEYAWERLGFSAANGGFNIGLMFAPADVFGVEADFSVLATSQDLRREYDSHTQGSNVNQVTPETHATAHIGIDITARAFIFPKKRVKLSPGLGATFLVMAGYNFDDVAEGQLDYTERPTTAVIGITPVVGVRIAATPFVHIYVDLAGTAYLHQGDTNYEDHLLFGTSEPYLTEDKKQVPLNVIPLMARLGGGVQLLF